MSSEAPFDPSSVVYEDNSFLVINKPTGLLSQSTFGVESLLFQVKRWLHLRESAADPQFAELPHRLDRGSSGVLLVAKNSSSLRQFGEQFQSRRMQKKYLIAVAGIPEQKEGCWTDWVRKIPDIAKAEIVPVAADGGREAILEYECLARFTDVSVHRVKLHTGRMHQIRLQFASRGFPVLGDQLYGSRSPWYPARRHAHDEHFALHAAELTLRHPKDARFLTFRAQLPFAWGQLLPDFHFDPLTF